MLIDFLLIGFTGVVALVIVLIVRGVSHKLKAAASGLHPVTDFVLINRVMWVSRKSGLHPSKAERRFVIGYFPHFKQFLCDVERRSDGSPSMAWYDQAVEVTNPE